MFVCIGTMQDPTCLARYPPPKSSGVSDFTFPMFLMVEKSGKTSRTKNLFISWRPKSPNASSLSLKKWTALSWLPKKLKVSVETKLATAIPATPEQIGTITRDERQLWSCALKEKENKPRYVACAVACVRVLFVVDVKITLCCVH